MAGQLITNALIDGYMIGLKVMLRTPLERAARAPRKSQERLLQRILKENAATEFGEAHGFGTIASLKEYRQRVPVQSFENLCTYIDRQIDGTASLTADAPVFYARTSGTTGRSKDIPLTRAGVRQVRHAQKHLALSLWRDTGFFKGSILGFASPAEEGRMRNGVAYGSTSGSTYRSLSPVLAKKFVVPVEAFRMDDAEMKYMVYALCALAAGNVTGVVTANPSSILKVIQLVDAHGQDLLAALLGKDAGAPEPLRELLPVIRRGADLDRAAKLSLEIRETGALSAHSLWPRLAAVATWTGGSCGVALSRLKARLPATVRIVEYGYGASEFMGAVNVDARTNLCLPLLNHHVYEFVPRADWEAGTPRFLGLDELVAGEDYYVFITTCSGLYRYNMNDVVRASEGVGGTPGLKFVQKGRGVTSITGEKLSESQLVSAVQRTFGDDGVPAAFIALADEENARYVLYAEPAGSAQVDVFADRLDVELICENSEYADKRASGRLAPARIVRMREGAGETIKSWSLERGVREAQYKPTLLDYSRNWSTRLAALAEDI